MDLYKQEAELLLAHRTIGEAELNERMFVLEGGLTVLGCLIEESNDSFVVALSSIIAGNGRGDIEVKLLSDRRLIRYLKSGVLHVSIPDGFKRYCYFKFLNENVDLMQDFFSQTRTNYLQEQIKEFESREDEPIRIQKKEAPAEISNETEDKNLPSNASKESFRYLYVHRTRQ